MKFANIEIINAMNVLDKYSNKKLPQKIGYAITRNLMIISKEYQVYEAQFKKMLDVYADYIIKDDAGNMIVNNSGIPVVKEEKLDEFNKELTDLLNIKVDLNLYLIDEEYFNYDDKAGVYDVLSVKEIFALQSILCSTEA